MDISVDTIEVGLKSNPRLEAHQKQILPASIQSFLSDWDVAYKKSISDISLFNTNPLLDWSLEKKTVFL